MISLFLFDGFLYTKSDENRLMKHTNLPKSMLNVVNFKFNTYVK